MRAITRLERQDLVTTYAVGSVEVGYNYLAYEAFTEYGPEAQLGYELRLHWPRLKLRAGYLIHRYDFRNPSELVDPALQMMIGIDHPELVGAYQQSIIADFRDHPVEPRLGVYGEIKVTEGTRYAGGDYTYQQVVPELRGYVPIGPVVIAARARYGAIYGEVPPTERFYAGGATSQRGFAERELSPSVTGMVMDGSTITVPYGGAGLIDTSIEARFPLARIKKMPLGAVVFLDGGDVSERPAELDLGNLNWAAGLGLRLLTVVGPVRADFGYRLNRTGPDDPQPGSSYAFHLSLGEAF
jgi:translocation and assembly module TamA